jgi:hypothetical protein
LILAAPGAAGPPEPGDVGPAAANPDDADPVKPDPLNPAAEPVKPDPVNPEPDPVKPDPLKPAAEPVKPDEAEPVKPDAPSPPDAGPSGAAMKPTGSSCGSAASASGPLAPACAPAMAPFFAESRAADFFAVPRAADLAAVGLRIGGWTAARTSARRAERAFRRRHVVIANISPSSSRKTTPAMMASLIRVPRMFRWIGLLCTAGGVGGAWPALPEAADLGTLSAMPAAAVSALAASTVPKPEPSARPPGRWYTVLEVIAWVICAGVSVGNWAWMSATMPATIALAALVLLSWG